MCTPWCAQHESWGASELKNGSTEKQMEKNGSKDTFHSIPHFLMMEILYIDWSLLIPNVSAQFLSAWTGWSHSGKFGKLFCHVCGPSLKTWGWQLAPQQPKLQFQFSQCAAPSDVILKADVKCQKWSLKTASIKPFIHIHIYIYIFIFPESWSKCVWNNQNAVVVCCLHNLTDFHDPFKDLWWFWPRSLVACCKAAWLGSWTWPSPLGDDEMGDFLTTIMLGIVGIYIAYTYMNLVDEYMVVPRTTYWNCTLMVSLVPMIASVQLFDIFDDLIGSFKEHHGLWFADICCSSIWMIPNDWEGWELHYIPTEQFCNRAMLVCYGMAC